MEFDVVTLTAQILNFIILMLVLKFILWGRITSAIDNREKELNSRFEKADDKLHSADEREKELSRKQREMDELRNAIIDDAKNEAKQQKKELLQKAHEEVDDKRRQWMDSLRSEKDRLVDDIRGQAAESVRAVSASVLRDMVDDDFQSRMVRAFAGRLGDLDPDDFSAAGTDGDEQPRVTSSFQLDDREKKQLGKVVHRLTGKSDSAFSVDTGQSPGIVLAVGSKVVDWTVDGYLDRLFKDIGDMLEAKTNSGEPGDDTTKKKRMQDDGAESAPGAESEKNDHNNREDSGSEG